MSLRVSALVVTGFVMVAACGGSGSKDTAAGGNAPQFGSEEFGLSDEDLNARIEAAEASIADCMTSLGFEYIPVDAATVRDAMNADKSLPGVRDEDFVAQYGFGITTVFVDPVAQLGRGENARIYDGLSEPEQVAYDHALLGDSDINVALARALEDEDLNKTGGCTRQAVEQHFAAVEMGASYVNPADVLIEQDPRMVEAISAWSACMHDAGFDYAHPDDVERYLHERFTAIVGDSDPASLTGSDLEALTELQGEERAVAGVTLQCEETHIHPVEDQVEADVYGA